MLRSLLAGAAALSLSACVSLLPKGEDLEARLGLDAEYGSVVQAEPLGATLSVMDPRAEAVFATANVAVLTAPLQYEYLAGAEWTDRAPLLLGRFLERRLAGTGAFDAVGDRVSLPVADYALQTDLRAMNLDQTEGRVAKVAYGARLTNRRGETVGTRVFRASVPVAGAGSGAVAQALNEAAAAVADETYAWMAPLIEADQAEGRARDEARAARRRS